MVVDGSEALRTHTALGVMVQPKRRDICTANQDAGSAEKPRYLLGASVTRGTTHTLCAQDAPSAETPRYLSRGGVKFLTGKVVKARAEVDAEGRDGAVTLWRVDALIVDRGRAVERRVACRSNHPPTESVVPLQL